MTYRFVTPGYEQAMARFVHEVVDGLVGLDPVLARIPVVPSEHRGPIRNNPEDARADQTSLLVQQSMVMHLDVVRQTKIEEYVETLSDLAQGIQDQLGKGLIDTLIRETEYSGNTIDAKGRPLSWDMILELIDNIALKFASDGTMISEPTVMLNPETAEKLRLIPIPEDFQDRLEGIFRRKKEEYFAQKRSRRLLG